VSSSGILPESNPSAATLRRPHFSAQDCPRAAANLAIRANERVRVIIRSDFTIISPREDSFGAEGRVERLPPSLRAAVEEGGGARARGGVLPRPVLRLICQNQFEAEGCKAGLRAARERYSICSLAVRVGRAQTRALPRTRTGVSRYVALRNRICSSLTGAYCAYADRIDRFGSKAIAGARRRERAFRAIRLPRRTFGTSAPARAV